RNEEGREPWVSEVVEAQAAVCAACATLDRNVRCVGSFAVRPVGREFLIHIVLAEVVLLCLTVFWAGLGHEDLTFPLEDGTWENAVAFWADALCSANELAYLLLWWL